MEKIPHNTGIVDPLNVRQYFIMGGLNLVIVINYYSGLHQCSFKKKKTFHNGSQIEGKKNGSHNIVK